MFKKKFHGKLSLFCGLLFCLLLGLLSTSCYARTTLTEEEVDYIVESALNPSLLSPLDYPNFNYSNTSSKFQYRDQDLAMVKEVFLNAFNTTNTLDFRDDLQDFFGCWNCSQQSNYQWYVDFFYTKINYGKFSNYPHLYLNFNSNLSIQNQYRLCIQTIDDNKNRIDTTANALRFYYNIYNWKFTYRQTDTTTFLNQTDNNVLTFNSPHTWNNEYLNTSKIAQISGIINFYSTNSVYTNFDGVNFYSTPIPKLLESKYVWPTPEEPEDSSGDMTGTITNNSGDTTGKIDLSGIQNGIDSINQSINEQGQAIINNQDDNTDRIIDNQNQNTQATVNAINNANENYWGNEDSLDGKDQEDFISDSINSLVDNISGDLNKNAVFEHLDSAENIFLDFFRNKQDESFYDLIISWDTVSPVITMFDGSVTVSNGQLINGDSINISQLCRDNPELAKIQQYIRIIFNFGCLIALLWQIYNLVLSTLGIDNPYLYEDADVTDVVNSDTGEVRSYYRTRKRYYKKR